MKNNFKKFAAIVLALVMCVSTLVPVFAADATCPGSGKTHTVENCTYETTSVVEATCGTDGKTTYKCTVCKDSFFALTEATEAHDYIVDTVAATCTTDGSVTETCSVCGDVKVTPLLATGHNWVYTWKDASKNDPCNRDKWTKRTCSVCGTVQNAADAVNGDATEGHSFELVSVLTESTCMTNGKALYACTVCGKTTESQLPVLTGHATATKIGTKTAKTCTTNEIAYYRCAICGTFEYEEPGTKSHGPFTALTAVEKTCTTAQIVAGDQTCNACGKICKSNGTAYTEDELNERKAAHTYVKDANSDVAATCTVKAHWTETCTGCGHQKTEYSSTPASHNYAALAEIVPATCTAAGYKARKCTVCGDEIEKQTINKLDHHITIIANLWVDGAAGAAVTVNYNNKTGEITGFDKATVQCGKQYRLIVSCSTCTTKHSTTYPVFPAHDYEKKVNTPATCTTEGNYKMECKGCGQLDPTYTGNKVEKIPATGAHTYYTAEDYKAAGTVVVDGNVTPDKLIGVATFPASFTCGNTIRVTQYCKVCGGAEKKDQQITLAHRYETDRDDFGRPKTAANYQLVPGTGDCAIKSEYKEKCLVCNAFNKSVVLTKDDGTGKGHAKDTENGYTAYLAPTCAAAGTTEGYYCKNAFCTTNKWDEDPEKRGAYVEAPVAIPSLHTLNANKDNMNKTAAVDATCTTDGNIEYYTCVKGADCAAVNNGYAFTVDKNGTQVANKADLKVAKLNHNNFTDAIKDLNVTASCEDYGYTAKVCKICDVAVKTLTFTPAVAHDYDADNDSVDEIEESRSCETGHFNVKTCNVCGHTEITPITGFETVGHYNKENTLITSDCHSTVTLRLCAYCNEIIVKDAHAWGEYALVDGEDVRYCATCGAEDKKAHVHTWGEAEVVAEATHLVEGSKVSTCTACGETKTEAIAKLTAHVFGEWMEEDGSKHFRQCECGYEEMGRHHWDEGVVTTEPAVGVEGVKTFTCADCLATKTESIAALPAPDTDAPETDAPETDAPETDAPETDAPETDAPETDAPETDAPETDAPETDAPETDAPETDAPETDAPATDAPETEAPTDKKGCKGSIAAIGVALVATLGTCAVFAGKKKED